MLAQEARLSDDGLETLEFGAFLHDIGKIGIKDAVLLKPGPLDDDEWMHMREHPVMGYDIASKIEMLQPIMPAVRNHHERWDGSGYPDKMVAEDDPARRAHRRDRRRVRRDGHRSPVQEGAADRGVRGVLRKTAGKMYDPELIEVFVGRHLGALYREDYDDLPYDDGPRRIVDVVASDDVRCRDV